jgi:hypothetical protein
MACHPNGDQGGRIVKKLSQLDTTMQALLGPVPVLSSDVLCGFHHFPYPDPHDFRK